MQGMGLRPTNPVGSHSLLQINTIPASTPSQELLQCILEHEKAGTPLVITGVDRDSEWHSQYSSVPEDGEPMNCRTGVVRSRSQPLFQWSSDFPAFLADPLEEGDTSVIFKWLETLSLVPRHFLSCGADTIFPPVVKGLRYERGGQGRFFYSLHGLR